MANRAEVLLAGSPHTGNYLGSGTNYVVKTPTGVLYKVYIDAGIDVVFSKSIDGGLSWSAPTIVFTGSATALAVWYDRWSNIAAGLIHCTYVDSGADDILYRSIDTEASDALGTQTTVFAGTDTLAGGSLSITRARGGNLVVAGAIDAGTEDGAWESADVGATWGSTIADPSEGASDDRYLLLPGWNADTQDVMLIFNDDSADEISVKRYDDSGDAWGETSIATSIVIPPVSATVGFPHMAAFVDITNSRNIVFAWSAVDGANADLRGWIIDDTTITEITTPVVSNGTDDQGLVSAGMDTVTGFWYVFYAGKSDGSETFLTAINLYYKVSQDAGVTWGAETLLTSIVRRIPWLICTPRFIGDFGVAFFSDLAVDELKYSSSVLRSSARFQIGM